MIITTNNIIPGRQLYDITLQQIGGAQLKQYLVSKHKWDDSTFSLINWQGLELTLDISDHSKRLNYTQLIHDWQNDGQQKYLFEQNKRQQQRTTQNITLTPEQQLLEEQELDSLAQCPFCKQQETHQHYLYCTNNELTQFHNTLEKQIKQKFERIGVYEGITALFLRGLTTDIHTSSHTSNIYFRVSLNLSRIHRDK